MPRWWLMQWGEVLMSWIGTQNRGFWSVLDGFGRFVRHFQGDHFLCSSIVLQPKLLGRGGDRAKESVCATKQPCWRDSQGTQAILQHSTGSANGKQPGSNLPLVVTPTCSKISKIFGGRCVRVRETIKTAVLCFVHLKVWSKSCCFKCSPSNFKVKLQDGTGLRVKIRL